MAHESVLLQEVMEGLDFQDGDVYLDATVGAGGHMEKVWQKMKERITITLDKELLEWLDKKIEDKIFANRSHGFERLIMERIKEENEEKESGQ